MSKNHSLPVYSLDKFRTTESPDLLYQVEVFDTNRHFQVSYPHKHDFYEILYLSQGSGFHIIDNNRYEIQPPCIFFMSPGQAHKLELSTDVNGYIFLFTSEFYHFNQKNKNRLLEFPFFFSVDQQNPPIYLDNEKDNNFLRELFERGCQKMTSSTKDKEVLQRALLDVLLISCDELYPHELRSVQKGKGIILVKNFLLLIEENYQKNLRINDYADMLAVTPNHLTQMVRQVTGKTSVTLLQERIIAEVKRLLIHTNMNVTEIAESMNFPDQSYFSKYFKKSTGLSPNQYRTQNN